MNEAQIQASTAEVTVTDADGTEWTFDLVPTSEGPIHLSVNIEREQVEMPSDGTYRSYEPGAVHASVKVRGRLVRRTAPEGVSA